MAQKIFNFAAGPGQLPPELLTQAAADMVDWEGTGLSVLELPFTSDEYRTLAARTEADLRALLDIPADYQVLFLHGGAYAHMGLLAMNLLDAGQSADYVITGHWSQRAATEAGRFGRVRVAASNIETGCRDIPPLASWQLDPAAAYCHITTNETADGVQFHDTPDTGDVPLVADMTSDFLSRPVPVTKYGLIYASTQKNAGIAGLTIVIIHHRLLRESASKIPAVFDYRRQAAAAGRVNTPPVFAIYFTGLMCRWLRDHGGVTAAARAGEYKSSLLYETIDAQPLYDCPVVPAARSRVNVCFQLTDPALQGEFLARAEECGLRFLAGHNDTGGFRASLYNAMPAAGAEALAEFMHEFAARRQSA